MEYEVIITILNRGFSDLVMDSARASGATGGTIVTARGTGAKEVQRLLGLTISQEKEIVLILTTKEQRNAIMTSIVRSAGLNTQGKGITFSLPVTDVLGVSLGINNLEKDSSETTEKEDVLPTKETSSEKPSDEESEQTISPKKEK